MKRFLPFWLNFACLCIFVSNSAVLSQNNNLQTKKFQQIALPDSASLVFNELMFEQSDSAAEYVEIINRSDSGIILSKIAVTALKSDGSWNKLLKFPEGYVLKSHEMIVITPDTALLRKHHPCAGRGNIFQASWSALNNTSATLVIVETSFGKIIDKVRYSAAWHHPLLVDEKGVALEKIHPDLSSADSSSWHSAATACAYGTPGQVNSQYTDRLEEPEGEGEFSADPVCFTPNGDGNDDYCYFRYHLPQGGYIGKVMITNLHGESVCGLSGQELLSEAGYFCWDGLTYEQKRADPGIYIAYAELFHPLKGKMLRFKVPVVISLF